MTARSVFVSLDKSPCSSAHKAPVGGSGNNSPDDTDWAGEGVADDVGEE
jgi:hypothetical protein